MDSSTSPTQKRPQGREHLSVRERVSLVARGALLLALVMSVAMAFTEHEEPLALGKKAPHAHLTSFDGRSWDIDRFEGKPVLLNFWATWCGPCLAELPTLVSTAEKHSDELIVVGAAITSPPEEVVAMIRQFGIRFPVAAPDSGTVERYRANAVPLTYLLDADHRVVWSARGAVGERQLEAAIADLLAQGG